MKLKVDSEKISNTDMDRLPNRKRITKIRNEEETLLLTSQKQKGLYGQLYANILDNLD